LAWRDAGVSAFRSGNLKEGSELSTFLRAVESKKIPKGSYLLIENLDRLSRAAPLTALNALQRLLSLGVYVVTLHDGKRYDAKSLASEDITDFLIAVLHAHRAHSESVVKSKRVREALKTKRQRTQDTQSTTRGHLPLVAQARRWCIRGPQGQGADRSHDLRVDCSRPGEHCRSEALELGARAR
jgi:DNA invertase Pin-like site-specific DNA recombinase